jgi:hypothetical protein
VRPTTNAGEVIALAGLLMSMCACTIPEAHGKPRRSTTDAGARPAKAEAGTPAKQHGLERPSLVGLTRAQVVERQGQPTEKHGNTWIYTPQSTGCREEIISEVVTFKGNVVVSVDMRLDRTKKICGPAEWGDR